MEHRITCSAILTAAPAVMRGTGRIIANFAWQHMKAATLFRDHVVALEQQHQNERFGPFFEEVRSYASACFMSSAASLEALINELLHGGKLRSQLPNFEEQFWGGQGIESKPTLEKYQIALRMLGAALLDEHSSPYRDAWALIALRNALVHYKPTWDPDRARTVELIEVLEGKFSLSPFPDDGSDFVSLRCMSAGCTKWAIATALAFMRAFHERAQLDEKKMSGFWKLEGHSVSD